MPILEICLKTTIDRFTCDSNDQWIQQHDLQVRIHWGSNFIVYQQNNPTNWKNPKRLNHPIIISPRVMILKKSVDYNFC